MGVRSGGADGERQRVRMRSGDNVRLVAAALVAVLLAACSNDPAEPAVATAELRDAAPSPSPAPPPDVPVEGGRTYSQWSASSAGILLRRAAAPVDAPGVDALMTAVGDWLDAHLEDLRRGGSGLLDAVAAPGLLDGADPALLAAVTTAMSSPDDPPVDARYDVRVHHDGGPEWVTVDTTVHRHSGRVSRAGFVFVGGESGPVLLLFGPEVAP